MGKFNARIENDKFAVEWSAKAALGLRSNEGNIQQQKIFERVTIAGIVLFGALISIIVTSGEKKNLKP